MTPPGNNHDRDHELQGESTAQDQRDIQKQQDRRDQSTQQSRSVAAAKKSAVQAGPRDHPEPPLPEQHLEKPGIEAEMELTPQFKAPGYRGSGELEGMTALITGGDSGIGRAVAILYAREGADVAIVYLSEDDDAEETRR